MSTTIVTTTINVPTFLESVFENAEMHDKKEFTTIVIGDVKTPKETKNYCNKLNERFSTKINYYNIDDQKEALSHHTELWEMMPLNDGARKMIGTFLAYIDGCDRVIMIDDDNYATGNDFIGYHSKTGQTIETDLVHSDSGWYNITKCMIEKNRIPFYPRGYPWSERFDDNSKIVRETKNSNIVVNAGLVLGDPDIDAISRLFWPIEVIAIDSSFESHFGLKPGTWAPFNDQNTSLARDIIPVYFKPPSSSRNADIWTSYIIEKLAEHFNDVVTYGQPLVKQIRNYHDLREDYRIEELNNRATDLFISIIRGITLSKKSYIDLLGELLKKALNNLSDIDVRSPVNYETNRGQHHQLPDKKVKENRKLEELDMIKNFFLEYLNWYNFISKHL